MGSHYIGKLVFALKKCFVIFNFWNAFQNYKMFNKNSGRDQNYKTLQILTKYISSKTTTTETLFLTSLVKGKFCLTLEVIGLFAHRRQDCRRTLSHFTVCTHPRKTNFFLTMLMLLLLSSLLTMDNPPG